MNSWKMSPFLLPEAGVSSDAPPILNLFRDVGVVCPECATNLELDSREAMVFLKASQSVPRETIVEITTEQGDHAARDHKDRIDRRR